ncbi:MAG: hypothetical protein HC850_08515 [Rhodomicrobium sp.]|nr:hypothetical protein [Rhodomicrobium sp.]
MAVPRILRIFKVRPEGNLEFWVSNLVIIFSTVLGVYLAAQAGYQTALDFETVRSERESYYLRRALLDELKDNLVQADEMGTKVAEGDWRARGGDASVFKLQSYVWETMKEHDTTFQIPPQILTGIRRYYDKAAANARYMASADGAGIYGAKSWMKDTQEVREKIVPLLEANIAELRKSLIERDVAVD